MNLYWGLVIIYGGGGGGRGREGPGGVQNPYKKQGGGGQLYLRRMGCHKIWGGLTQEQEV